MVDRLQLFHDLRCLFFLEWEICRRDTNPNKVCVRACVRVYVCITQQDAPLAKIATIDNYLLVGVFEGTSKIIFAALNAGVDLCFVCKIMLPCKHLDDNVNFTGHSKLNNN